MHLLFASFSQKKVGPVAKREGVAHLQALMGLSERRACSIVSADRTMIRYQSCRPPDAALRAQLRDLAHKGKRFGYASADRRLHRNHRKAAVVHSAATGGRVFRDQSDLSASIEKKASRSASGALDGVLLGRGRRSSWKRERTPAGPWILFATSFPAAGVFAS